MLQTTSRTVRIFLSSTFRDFGEERDLLVRKVFPGLRARLRERFVELVDVDLRWGITIEQAERGEVLPICLAEIDRARPFFVGMLGERYGWVPPKDSYDQSLLQQQLWLDKHRGDKSVTELEILHGVLNDPKMAGRAFFYFRSPDYAKRQGGDYLPASPEDAARQARLKDRIRQSGFPVVEDYKNPEAFAARLEKDLWATLDAAFPADEVPDSFSRETQRHEAYAAPRRRLYLGGHHYIAELDQFVLNKLQRVLIEGQSGGGKSALLANWIENFRRAHPEYLFHVHYTGASADASDPYALVRRLCEAIKRTTLSEEEIPNNPQLLLESFSLWLAHASAYATKNDTPWVIVIDALNGIIDLRDVRWLPENLPANVNLVISCLSGEIMNALKSKSSWQSLMVRPMNDRERETLLTSYLAQYNKTLPDNLKKQILSHPLSSNPLFVRTLAEELRIFGVHEELEMRIDYYLRSETVDDLFEKVLERVENDCGVKAVTDSMKAILASRNGLTEYEILGIAQLVPAIWAPIRHSLDEALLISGGRIIFAHNYVHDAVSNRYAFDKESRADAHTKVLEFFEHKLTDSRFVEEVPYQLISVSDLRKNRTDRLNDLAKLQSFLTGKYFLSIFFQNRSNTELMIYWQFIEPEKKTKLEDEYALVWNDWLVIEDSSEDLFLVEKLIHFFLFTDRKNDFVLKVAQFWLDSTEKFYGKTGGLKAAAMSALGMLFLERENYEEAEKYLQCSLDIEKKENNKAMLATATSNLGLLFLKQKKYESAEPLLRLALDLSEKANGPNHPSTAISLNLLAQLLQSKNQLEDVEGLLRRALQIAEAVNGPNDPVTALRLHNLAMFLWSRGDAATSATMLKRSYEIFISTLGNFHSQTAKNAEHLADLLIEQRKSSDAQELYRVALKGFEASLPNGRQKISEIQLKLINSFAKSKSSDIEAESIYRQILERMDTQPNNKTIEKAQILNDLATITQRRAPQEAVDLFSNAYSIISEIRGENHPENATALNNLAGALYTSGDILGAEKCFLQSLKLYEIADSNDNLGLSNVLNSLGACAASLGRLDEAELLMRRGLARASLIRSKNPMYFDNSFESLSALLTQLKRGADPLSILSRGDFLVIVSYAKATAKFFNKSSLTPIDFLSGVLLAEIYDKIWSEEIRPLLNTELRKKIEQGLNISPSDLKSLAKPVFEKMPLSEELKIIIVNNKQGNLKNLIADLASNVFNDN